jgi:hypothetical protein
MLRPWQSAPVLGFRTKRPVLAGRVSDTVPLRFISVGHHHTLVDGEPFARIGRASRPSNEGNNNFLVW